MSGGVPDGWIELTCKECSGVFQIDRPDYSLLMYPLCSSCQRTDDDKTETEKYPLSRGD